MAEKKDLLLGDAIAAGMYYEQTKSKQAWENLTDDQKGPYISQAASALIAIDKINKGVYSKVDPNAALAERMACKEKILEIIQSFVKTLKHPPRIAEHFPSEELSMRILEGRITIRPVRDKVSYSKPGKAKV
jgi:hypothetical protein